MDLKPRGVQRRQALPFQPYLLTATCHLWRKQGQSFIFSSRTWGPHLARWCSLHEGPRSQRSGQRLAWGMFCKWLLLLSLPWLFPTKALIFVFVTVQSSCRRKKICLSFTNRNIFTVCQLLFLSLNEFIYLYSMYMPAFLCVTCVCSIQRIQKRASHPIELELQGVVICQCECWGSKPNPLKEQPVRLTAEPVLQPLENSFKCFCCFLLLCV